MDINVLENVISLSISIIGLLLCLFRFIETPRRGWMHMSLFYLSCLMSDYYWTTYILVMHSNSDNGPVLASFGWNISVLFLIIIILSIQNPKVKNFFHPLMLLPILVNIVMYILCSQNGGFINNLWQCLAATFISFITFKAVVYWILNRKNGAHFPHFSSLLLLYIMCQCGIWVCSSYTWESLNFDPYYIFAFASFVPLLLIPEGIRRDIAGEGIRKPKKDAYEMRLQVVMQAVVFLIVSAGCVGGYFIASSMRDTLSAGGDIGYAGTVVAVVLFTISVFMTLLILSVITLVAFRNRRKSGDDNSKTSSRRSRFNLVFTLIVTLILMTFTVAYNARLLFGASVERIYESGQEKAASTAIYLENYITVLESSLWTTADTVEMMIYEGETDKKIRNYLVKQTTNRKSQFNDSFSEMYGYLCGVYMDGAGWKPPEGFDPETRDWYRIAVDGGGDIELVSPYLDAKTGGMVMSVCKLLDDGKKNTYEKRNVIAVDMYVDYIQNVIQEQNVSGKGYGMVVDENGLIIAHQNAEYDGKYLSDVYGPVTSANIQKTKDGKIDAVIGDEHCSLFISPILDKWSTVIVISDSELFGELQNQVLVNILVTLGIFFLITVFYYLSYKNEQVYSMKMEEMSINRQKQEYDAEVLRLEKLAADEANKAKGSFLADMSHEIRTPINAILGMNEMILRESNDPGVREYARNIGNSGKTLLQLINSILDFSKIEDGKMEIVPVHYNLSGVISYLVNSISERARGKGLELIVNADPSLPSKLIGDDTRINQVIMNLLTNAVKYTHQGSVTLTMETAKKTAEDVLIRVEVKDTGIGIKESEMDKLFESFERLDVVRNRNIEGTGLGMSITTRLLKLMDSELKVESEYGVGSVFSFEIWQKIDEDIPLGELTDLSTEEAPGEVYHESFHAPDAHILIVDDTRMNIIVATGLLRKTGINIESASNGPDAVKLADRNVYDVILLDQRMPGIDGIETLKYIRESASGRNKETPVICLTADAIAGARERYIEEGFSDYLTKPVNGSALEEMLRKYLPADKIVSGSPYSSLSDAGLDTESGLNGFNGDKEFYESILAEFALDHGERYGKLQEFYENKDWENYKISVHALKSSSKTIGAFELSEIALGLETASGEGNMEVIERDHPKAMELYNSTVAAIKDSVDIEKYALQDDWDEV